MASDREARVRAVDLTRPESFAHWTSVTIRFSDTDCIGHINNIAIATYFESARCEFYDALLGPEDTRNLTFVLVRVAIDYRQEFFYPGVVKVGARLLEVRNKSLLSGYGAFLDGRCVATSEAVNCSFDKVLRRSVPVPHDVRSLLQSAAAF